MYEIIFKEASEKIIEVLLDGRKSLTELSQELELSKPALQQKHLGALEEMFDLVIPGELWSTSVIKGFMDYIDPVRINSLSKNLPGYNLKDTGKIRFEN